LSDRHAPRDGRKAKHTLKHTGPYRVIRCLPPFAYSVSHVHTGAVYKAHFFHMSLASEVTQLKYRSVGVGGPGGGKNTVNHYDNVIDLPDVDMVTPTAISSQRTLMSGNTQRGQRSTDRDYEGSDTNPFGPDLLRNSTSGSNLESVSELLQSRPHHSTKTTRSGRVLSVPHRYLALFLVSQATTEGRLVKEEPEEGRM
jgi:hypothetical protein